MPPQNQNDEEELASEATEFFDTFREHLRAGYQVLYVNTSEEARVEVEIGRAARRSKSDVITWDCASGFGHDHLKNNQEYKDPIKALDAIVQPNLLPNDTNGHHVFVFRDLDDYLQDPRVRRRIKTYAETNGLVNSRFKRPLVILSALSQIPAKLRTAVTVLDFKLPDESQMLRKIEFVRASVAKQNVQKAQLSPELADQIAVNLLGLTSNEAENCLSRCFVIHDGFKQEMLGTIKEEKAAIIKKSEVLTYIPEDSIRDLSTIGGYDQYIEWLEMRKKSYSRAAQAQMIDFPRGVVLLGLPGTGKSMIGKTTCKILGLPGYILDIGSLFGSLVGESEQRTRDVLKQIDAQKGCVLMIDEADKALGNAHSSTGDSGVTRRVFGAILTWLAENKSRTFTIMTLNRTDGLPPELTRAGRFDAMFYTDLPNDLERRQILDIHLRIRGVDPNTLPFKATDWGEVIKKTENFVGSELEEVVREARYRAFARTNAGIPSFEDMIEAAGAVIPMMQRDPAAMDTIRDFCKNKARPVTSPTVVAGGGGRRHRAVE